MAISPARNMDSAALRELIRFESPSMRAAIEDNAGPVVSRAEGVYVWDSDGRRYLDMTAGSGVHALGYGDERLLAAMTEQMRRFVHGGWQLVCQARSELSERLAGLLPWPDPVLMYCTTGSEAVEASLKAARAATGRRQVLGFLGGYHGQTAGSLAVTANSQFRQNLTEVPVASLSLPYPAAAGYQTGDRTGDRTPDAGGFAYGREILEHPDFGLADVAGLIVEPVQGPGVIAARPGWLAELREFTRRNGILLIMDEIFTGLGRTGTMFGFQHDGIEPDLLVMGKAMGGGIPISVVAGPREIMDRFPPRRQTSTFSASPVACAAGAHVLRRLAEDDLPRRAAETGEALARALGALRIPGVDITPRGQGLMLGAHVRAAGGAEFVRDVVTRMRASGVLVMRGGADGQLVRMTPPLILPADAALAAVETFERSVRDALG